MRPIVSAAAGFGGGRGRRGAGEARRRHRVGAACTAVVFTALLWFLVAALLAGHAGGSTARAAEDSWTPGRLGVSSSFANAPPVIDGIAAIGEWADATTVPLENGRLRLQHDAVNLYLLLDVTADLSSGPGDYFWLVFDENRDGAITAGVDSCYTIRQVSPGVLGLGVQLFSGPGAWGPVTACDSRAKAGFGESAALEYPHRVWEFAISLAEVQAAAGGSVRLGIRAASEADGYMEEYPAALFVDFSGLLQVNLPAPTVDLLVLTDQAFTAALVPFKEHKDVAGIGTYVQTWQDVDDALAHEGADPPERIKRAIARYVEACGTRYVMLVGDSNRFPVRYFMTDRGTSAAFDRAFYPTDYYYADLYAASGAFNDWDANNDGYYAELHGETIAGPMNIDRRGRRHARRRGGPYPGRYSGRGQRLCRQGRGLRQSGVRCRLVEKGTARGHYRAVGRRPREDGDDSRCSGRLQHHPAAHQPEPGRGRHRRRSPRPTYSAACTTAWPSPATWDTATSSGSPSPDSTGRRRWRACSTTAPPGTTTWARTGRSW